MINRFFLILIIGFTTTTAVTFGMLETTGVKVNWVANVDDSGAVGVIVNILSNQLSKSSFSEVIPLAIKYDHVYA